MTIRERIEKEEKEELSPYACLSINSKGRARDEEQCDIRPVFQRDRDRILHSKSFRRLKDKTQVFLLPEGDHYRTRLTHTLEVSQNARTIAKALRMNEDLVEAIALGHDLGHTPFGHSGERILNEICPFGFKHNEQSLRTVDVLEKDGAGLNLTFEVRDGILNHQTACMPSTLEGKIVRLSDKIAYIVLSVIFTIFIFTMFYLTDYFITDNFRRSAINDIVSESNTRAEAVKEYVEHQADIMKQISYTPLMYRYFKTELNNEETRIEV